MSLLIQNCRLVSPGVDRAWCSLRAEGDRIVEIGEDLAARAGEEIVDGQGWIAMPGFIDIHSHGRSGADFCDATQEAMQTLGREKLQDGVTGFLATTLTVSSQTLRQVCREAAAYAQNPDAGATMLGVHLEGPFLNPECAGAQNPDYLRLPDIGLVDELNAIAPVKKVSYSPELEGAMAFTRELVQRGIVASAAHSSAEYECFEEARAAGLTHITHFCNMITPLHHLRLGMVGGGLLAPEVFVEIICDGIHLLDPMIDLIVRIKGPERVMLITDSMMAAGCPDGEYSLGGLPARVAGGCARLLTGQIAGSTLVYDKGFQRYVRASKLPLCEAVRATSLNQAVSLGIPDRGKLQEGYFADIVLTNGKLEPQMTIVNGRIKWRKNMG
ncbi:MAG: N-acetylglucosamine-6-phosphate deacetylase [Planctomycetia bacterium]|nr:N-acetylglucosamine-6-phosphate deacetylase [Planctomycetia bacterium]